MNAKRIANQYHATFDHFSQTAKMVDIGSGARREIEDFRLSRYAC